MLFITVLFVIVTNWGKYLLMKNQMVHTTLNNYIAIKNNEDLHVPT